MHLRAVGSRRLGITTRCKARCSTKLVGAELPHRQRNTLGVAKRRSSRHYPRHWSLQPILSKFAQITKGMQHSIIKINRDSNNVADWLAKQARQATIPSPCLFSCIANVHSTNQCTVQSAHIYIVPVDMGFLSSALDNKLYLLELSVLEGDSKGLHKQQMDGILEVLTVSEIIILVVHEFHRPGHVEYALQ